MPPNLCDRLPRLHERKGRRWVREQGEPVPIHAHSRPWRDRAIVYVLLSTGLRREELVRLDLGQLMPTPAAGLRAARRARLSGMRGPAVSDEGAAGIDAAYGERIKRLTALKDRYDPTNFFRLNHNIPPSVATRPNRGEDSR